MATAESEKSQLHIAPVQPGDRHSACRLVLGRVPEAQRQRLLATLRPDAATAADGGRAVGSRSWWAAGARPARAMSGRPGRRDLAPQLVEASPAAPPWNCWRPYWLG